MFLFFISLSKEQLFLTAMVKVSSSNTCFSCPCLQEEKTSNHLLLLFSTQSCRHHYSSFMTFSSIGFCFKALADHLPTYPPTSVAIFFLSVALLNFSVHCWVINYKPGLNFWHSFHWMREGEKSSWQEWIGASVWE